MKKYLLTACYLLLTFVIFKHPVEVPQNETPMTTPKEEVEESFAKNAIAKKIEMMDEKTKTHIPPKK